MEVVYPRDGDAMTLRPCPPWCTCDQHFTSDVIHADDGYHHYGPEVAVPTSFRMFNDDPETVVKVILKSWTHPLDAEPGPSLIELQLATTESNTDTYVEMTPDKARAIAEALFELADTAEGTDDKPG
jgi:hypothetical protein